MNPRALRTAAALTAALATAIAPITTSAQTKYEFKRVVPGLMKGGSGPNGGSAAAPALGLSALSVDFGSVATNTTEKRQIVVSNTGDGALSITQAPTVSGAAEFAAGLTSCGSTLAAGADCLLEPTFSPTTTGTFNGVLTFTTALAGSPHDITLAGTAFNPVSLAAATLPVATVGSAYSYDFKNLLSVSNEASPDKSQATWAGSGTLPAGLSLDTGTGVLSGTPSAVDPGASYTVTGTYKNNQGQQVFTIKVGDAVLEAVQVSAGDVHACAVTAAGGVKCWGYGESAGPGTGLIGNRSVPTDVPGLTSGVASIATGYYHNCALLTSGGLKCWGAGGGGQLGDGTTSGRLTPVDVSGLSSGVTSVTAGHSHTCAVTTTGGVKCWGRNTDGQLGDGTTSGRLTPVDVSGLSSGVTSVTAGHSHTCAATATRELKCWGLGTSGQLGDGSTSNRRTPVDVLGLTSGVARVSAGQSHTCAVLTEGAAKCWGLNQYAQLGDATTARRLIPVDVFGLSSGVASVSAGQNHTCAVTTAGGAKCWGRNEKGQLGTGAAGASSPVPVNVLGLTTGVASLSLGRSHTYAATADGVKSWGDDGYGQLGNDAALASYPTPVNVAP